MQSVPSRHFSSQGPLWGGLQLVCLSIVNTRPPRLASQNKNICAIHQIYFLERLQLPPFFCFPEFNCCNCFDMQMSKYLETEQISIFGEKSKKILENVHARQSWSKYHSEQWELSGLIFGEKKVNHVRIFSGSKYKHGAVSSEQQADFDIWGEKFNHLRIFSGSKYQAEQWADFNIWREKCQPY